MSNINIEQIENAVRRLESAAEEAKNAADRLEEVLRQFRFLTESGYGNNIEGLIERIDRLEGGPSKIFGAIASIDGRIPIEELGGDKNEKD